jgi:hypothetical protein
MGRAVPAGSSVSGNAPRLVRFRAKVTDIGTFVGERVELTAHAYAVVFTAPERITTRFRGWEGRASLPRHGTPLSSLLQGKSKLGTDREGGGETARLLTDVPLRPDRLPFHVRFLGVVLVLLYVALALWGTNYLLQPNSVASVVNPEN